MKVIQIVPQEGLALYATLVKKEAELRKKNRGRFIGQQARNGILPSGVIEPILAG